jgi:hypothetical protein
MAVFGDVGEVEELLPGLPVQLEGGGSNEGGGRALYPINTREVGRTPSQLQSTGYSWYPC